MSYKTTLLPDYIDIVQNTSIEFYNTSTNIIDAFSNYLGELKVIIDFERAKSSNDVLTSMALLFNKLNKNNFNIIDYNIKGEEDGTKDIDDIFKLYFIEKYHSLCDKYKTAINSLISNNNIFTNFSDDIGHSFDTTCLLDNNTSPYYDLFQDDYFILNSVPSTIYNKISKNEKGILKYLSLRCDTLHRVSLSGLQTDVVKHTATLAHGDNLVTDILYFDRIVSNQISFLEKISYVLGNIYDFISFFKQINPKDLDPNRKSIFYKYTITDMENLSINVDVLKNEIDNTAKSIKQVLG